MHHERRQSQRYMALVKTTGRVGEETFPLVCSNVGPGGAYFSSRIALTPAARLKVSLRAPGHNAPFVDLEAEIVWSTPPGDSRPAGVAVRWLRADSGMGAEPLRALLRGLLRMSELGDLERATSRTVSFDFVQYHAARAAQSAVANRTMAASMRPMVVPRMEPVIPAAEPEAPIVPAPSVHPTRTDRVVPEQTVFERREAARRGSGLRTFPTIVPVSGPYDAQPERVTQRRASGTSVTVSGAAPAERLPPESGSHATRRRSPSHELPRVETVAEARATMPAAKSAPPTPPPAPPPREPLQPTASHASASNSLTFAPMPPTPRPFAPVAPPQAGVIPPSQGYTHVTPGYAPATPVGRLVLNARGFPLPPQAPGPGTPPIPHLVSPHSSESSASPARLQRPLSRPSRLDPPSATAVSSSHSGFSIPKTTSMRAEEEARSWPLGVPRVLAERYANLELLGQGGHGVVFRAHDLLLERLVVLKFLAGTGMAPEQARRYFLREFKVSADLLHPNIIRLYDIGSADGTLYYTMEYIPGHPLGHYLGKNQRLDDHLFAYSVFMQLASALDHAHRNGVLHRDVKPNNVLVADDGTVRLFDFGLARLLSDGARDQSMVVGTPFYMAPEMQKTAPVDARADQYALGVVLYRMLTGRVPFADGNIFLAHAIAPVPDPRVFHAELPAGVSPIVTKMLAKLPEDRYPDCATAAAELFPVLTGRARHV